MGKFGDFILFKHLAEKSLANKQISQRVISGNYYFEFGVLQTIHQICQAFLHIYLFIIACKGVASYFFLYIA